ncbi:unnamed protein product [Urochloa humidicola]
METIIRRCRGFVVAENYDKTGVYSLHHLDVSKHLFYPSTIHAQCANTTGGGTMEEERLQELHAPCFRIRPALTTVAGSPKMAFFGLIRHQGRLLEHSKGWYWQSFPPPPFVRRHGGAISSYTALEGGRTICLSSAAEGVGSYFFETVRGEWSRAGDWVLPFTGRAQYVADLNLWLGFSLQYPHDLCAASGLTALATTQAPTTLLPLWQYGTPAEWMATKMMNLINLGSGRFVIVKVCKVIRNIGESDMVEDAEGEFLVLTGVEIR